MFLTYNVALMKNDYSFVNNDPPNPTGVGAIQDDMDEPGSALMANHGYCSQEMVNLCLVGYSGPSNIVPYRSTR